MQPTKCLGCSDGETVTAVIDRRGVLIEVQQNGTRLLAVRLVHPQTKGPALRSIRNFKVATEGSPPADDRSVKARQALLERLDQSSVRLPWEKRPAPRYSLSEDALRKARDTIERANYRIVIGQPEEGIRLLGTLPRNLPPSMVLDRAIAYHTVGLEKEMNSTLEGVKLEGAYGVAARILRQGDGPVKVSLDQVLPKDVCSYVSVIDVLNTLERYKELLALAKAIREKDASCAAAWDAEFNEHTRRKDLHAALRIAETAYQAKPEDRLARLRYGSAMQRLENFAKAAEIYESIARDFPNEQGILRLTLGVMLRDIPGRGAHKERLSRRWKSDPSDIVSQFLRGVLHHYENEFKESNHMLRPLEKTLSYEQRIDIYLAMNDFNLGKKEEALMRLNRAAKAPIPDPDVFYCRAEILRDERREQAISDLERYLATSERSLVSNPGKQTRV